MLRATAVLGLFLAATAQATVLFKEEFGEGWRERWVDSTAKGSDAGTFKWAAPKYYNDANADKGIQTSQDSKYYAISSKFPEAFSNKDKDIVVQFQVQHGQGIDCGGGYVKIFPSSLEQSKMQGESPYNIMFGPDICGTNKIVHVIFTYKGKNLLKKTTIAAKHDEDPHLYTLVVSPNNSYQVLIDNNQAASGSLEDDWEFLQPKTIPDPEAKKPEDWDDRAEIPDPESKKPEDWDNEPEFIADPDASKPEDWDDEDDGEWEAPSISNPKYNGAWKPKMMANPDFKGIWVRPEIPNPNYEPASDLYLYEDNAYIGLDLWQVKSGSIFDNIIVTDSLKEAKEFAKETFDKLVDGAQKMKDAGVKSEEEKKVEEEEKEASEVEEEEEEDEIIKDEL